MPPGPIPPGPPGGGSGAWLQAPSSASAPATATIRASIDEPPSRWMVYVRRNFRGSAGLTEQRRPGRVRRIARGVDLALVAAGQVDREEPRRGGSPAAGTAAAEIHQTPPVRRPGRSLDEKILRQEPLAGTVRPHDTDIKRPAVDLGEGDQIAPRRPDRRPVFARAEADALGLAAARIQIGRASCRERV